MKNKDPRNDNKVVHIDTRRKGSSREKGSVTSLLNDTHQAACAIQTKTCLLCKAQKLCVNKTGLCASCYSSLSSKEKRIADREAGHKTIEVKVTDDRWNDKDNL